MLNDNYNSEDFKCICDEQGEHFICKETAHLMANLVESNKRLNLSVKILKHSEEYLKNTLKEIYEALDKIKT